MAPSCMSYVMRVVSSVSSTTAGLRPWAFSLEQACVICWVHCEVSPASSVRYGDVVGFARPFSSAL